MRRRKRYSTEFKKEALGRADEPGVTDRLTFLLAGQTGHPGTADILPDPCGLTGLSAVAAKA